jgi:hypothetical protein
MGAKLSCGPSTLTVSSTPLDWTDVGFNPAYLEYDGKPKLQTGSDAPAGVGPWSVLVASPSDVGRAWPQRKAGSEGEKC